MPRQSDAAPTPSDASAPGAPAAGHAGDQQAAGDAADQEALAAHLEELRGQLLATPVEVVVANHAYGLFELAAIHLSERPPALGQARLAIDALGAIVEGLAGRMGDAEPSLVDALAQIRMAFVQIQATLEQTPGQPPPGEQPQAVS